MAISVTFKFTTGDKVYLMDDNKVLEGEIVQVQFNQVRDKDNINNSNIRYTISRNKYEKRKDQLFRQEEYVFTSKEELIASL